MNDTPQKTEHRPYEEVVEEILNRFSVHDLIEQQDEDLAVGDERFYKATSSFTVIDRGETNLIKWWQIQSGRNQYECRRFKNFVFCSCKSFFFSKKMCKHLAVTTRVYCANCFEMPAAAGKLCYGCDDNKNAVLNRSSKPQTFVSTGRL